MTSSESAPQPGSGQLLAVACPTCFAAIAVGAELFGRPADCPLCGGGFNVPLKAAPTPEAAAGQPPRQRPRADDGSGKRDEHADTTGAATAAPAPATPTDTLAAPPDPAAATGATVSPAPGFAPSTTLAGGHPDPAAVVATAAAAPGPSAELAFREPVMTVGSGDNVIELRRLTPEEKAQRRARRNIVMLLTGVSILMAIVLSLGRSRR